MFQLDHRLEADTQLLGAFPLSLLLLSKDANYPWCILVPQREDIREIYQLNEADRQQLLDESCLVAETLNKLFAGDKINVAAIGNMVPQLHMHHVVRFKTDAAWPGPVWGAVAAATYPQQLLTETAERIVTALAPLGLATE
jgi:diadenosine tetraphosphate (Ap4A) HIT family hydrolase|tara:strand:- start:638 stop:1060 length:423 start_codon:yes stop_codon:yes gene_type:complete